MSSGGSGGGQNTVTQVQQIPAYEQQFSQQNQNLSQSLGQNPYPLYQGQLVAGFSPDQAAALNMVPGLSTGYQPGVNAANAATGGALMGGQQAVGQGQQTVGQALGGLNTAAGLTGGATQYGQQAVGQAMGGLNTAANETMNAAGTTAANPGVIQQYMNPYVQAALAPQVQALQTQLGQQQQAINAQATGAGAFGDARQGVMNSLANFQGDQSLNNLLSQGYNSAYQSALGAAQNQQQIGLQGANQMANIASTGGQLGLSNANLGLQGANQIANIANTGGQLGLSNANLGLQNASLGLQGGAQLGNLAGLGQQLGLTGANALYNAGQQQQTLQQQQLNTAYQQFQNQAMWPYQMLNIQESALSNSPYSISNQTTLPNANMAATGLGAFAGTAGALGSLFSGSSGGSTSPTSPAPLGAA